MLLADLMVPVTITRKTPGNYTDVEGDWTPGELATLTLQAHVQPVTSSELQFFPEGLRTKGSIKIYTDETLQTASEATQTQADVVAYAGQLWQVQQVEVWAIAGLAYCRSIAFKVEPPPESI